MEKKMTGWNMQVFKFWVLDGFGFHAISLEKCRRIFEVLRTNSVDGDLQRRSPANFTRLWISCGRNRQDPNQRLWAPSTSDAASLLQSYHLKIFPGNRDLDLWSCARKKKNISRIQVPAPENLRTQTLKPETSMIDMIGLSVSRLFYGYNGPKRIHNDKNHPTSHEEPPSDLIFQRNEPVGAWVHEVGSQPHVESHQSKGSHISTAPKGVLEKIRRLIWNKVVTVRSLPLEPNQTWGFDTYWAGISQSENMTNDHNLWRTAPLQISLT